MTAQPVTFDPSSPQFHLDRHGVYRQLRNEVPLYRVIDEPPMVLISRYADVSAVLNDRTVRMSPEGFRAPPWLGVGDAAEMYANQMLLTDHPDHTRLRRVTTPAFRPKSIAHLQRALEDSMAERVERLRQLTQFDAVRDLAEHVPAVAVCTMLGIPKSDWSSLIRGAIDFVLVLSPVPLDDSQRDRAERSCTFYLEYFRDLVAERRRHPGNDVDFLTTLIAAQDAGQLSEQELLVTAHSVLNAGFETTMSALSNALYGLLGEPGQWELLVGDPHRSVQAVEEALRWEAPAQLLTRFAPMPIELDSGTIDAGTTLLLAVASANRDDRRFTAPDRFDLRRTDNAHLSMSAGRHACIGAHLGRMELMIALRALATAFPHLRLADDTAAERESNPVFPTLRRLDLVTA